MITTIICPESYNDEELKRIIAPALCKFLAPALWPKDMSCWSNDILEIVMTDEYKYWIEGAMIYNHDNIGSKLLQATPGKSLACKSSPCRLGCYCYYRMGYAPRSPR